MTLDEYLQHGQLDRMAQSLGVRREYLSRIRHRKERPSFDLSLQISAATSGAVSVESLMGEQWEWPAGARLRELDPVPTAAQIHKLDFELRCMRVGIDPETEEAAELLERVEAEHAERAAGAGR